MHARCECASVLRQTAADVREQIIVGMGPSTAPDYARGFRQRFEGDLAGRLRVVFPVCHTASSDTGASQGPGEEPAESKEDSDDDWGPWSAVTKRARVASPVQVVPPVVSGGAQSSGGPDMLEHQELWNLLQ